MIDDHLFDRFPKARRDPRIARHATVRRTDQLPPWLGGSWSGWTVAGWVDEVLRPGAAACDDGEDFRLKDVA